MSLESYLVKKFGLSSSPRKEEVDRFCNHVLAESILTETRIEKIAKDTFSGYQKRKIHLNESEADSIYDLITLIKKKMGK